MKSRAKVGRALQLVVTTVPVIAITAVMIEPGPLNLTVAWLSLGAFAAMNAGADIGNVLHVLRNVLFRLLNVLNQATHETRMIRWLRRRQGLADHTANLAIMVLPVLAVLVFAVLLSVANPLIAQVLTGLSWFNLFSAGTLRMAIVFMLTACAIWPLLRLKLMAIPSRRDNSAAPNWHRVYFQPMSVALTLLFLALHLKAMQNEILRRRVKALQMAAAQRAEQGAKPGRSS